MKFTEPRIKLKWEDIPTEADGNKYLYVDDRFKSTVIHNDKQYANQFLTGKYKIDKFTGFIRICYYEFKDSGYYRPNNQIIKNIEKHFGKFSITIEGKIISFKSKDISLDIDTTDFVYDVKSVKYNDVIFLSYNNLNSIEASCSKNDYDPVLVDVLKNVLIKLMYSYTLSDYKIK